MLAALRSARTVTFSSYLLRPGPVEQALGAAAERGADVKVHLDGYLWGGTPAMTQANRHAVEALRRAGADVQVVHRSDGDGPGLHLKAAVCDGIAYLDDCNWNMSGDTVVRDDARSHVRAIRKAALAQDVAPAGALALTKADALAAESAVLGHAARRDELDVETEALHRSPISGALRKLAKAGVRCRLLVSARAVRSDEQTRASVASLKNAGVEVRVVRSSEKLAICGTSHAWVGSADATSTYYDGDRIDWGLRSDTPSIVRGLKARFNAHWDQAAGFAGQPSRCR